MAVSGGPTKRRTPMVMRRYQEARSELRADLQLLELIQDRYARGSHKGLAEAHAAATSAVDSSLAEYLEAAEEAGFGKT